MADVALKKGGTPTSQFPYCEGVCPIWGPPFGYDNYAGTPEYDSHMDAAYGGNRGYFTQGMPINPKIMTWQRDCLRNADLEVDDLIQVMVIAWDHYVTAAQVKVSGTDTRLAGATFELTAISAVPQENGTWTYSEIPNVTAAAAAQGVGDPIDWSTPSSTTVWLQQVGVPSTGLTATIDLSGVTADTTTGALTGTATATLAGAGTGYATPLLSTKEATIVMCLKVLALPTNPDVTLDTMLNLITTSFKVEGFECPAHM